MMDKNTKRLRELMNGMTCKQVGDLIGRSEMTVRIWRCGTGRKIPDHMLALLEFKLA